MSETRDGVRVILAILVAAGIPNVLEQEQDEPAPTTSLSAQTQEESVVRNVFYWEEDIQD